MFFYFLMLFYFITFTPKWFALAVAAVSAELRAILLNKIYRSLHFLCRFVNSAHAESQNSDIPSSIVGVVLNVKSLCCIEADWSGTVCTGRDRSKSRQLRLRRYYSHDIEPDRLLDTPWAKQISNGQTLLSAKILSVVCSCVGLHKKCNKTIKLCNTVGTSVVVKPRSD